MVPIKVCFICNEKQEAHNKEFEDLNDRENNNNELLGENGDKNDKSQISEGQKLQELVTG